MSMIASPPAGWFKRSSDAGDDERGVMELAEQHHARVQRPERRFASAAEQRQGLSSELVRKSRCLEGFQADSIGSK
jgi:hypothetical protein